MAQPPPTPPTSRRFGEPPASEKSEEALMAEYLSALDLGSLHPDALEGLDEGSDANGWLMAGAVGLVSALGLSAWLWTTSFFVLSSWGEPLFFGLLAIAAILGIGIGPALKDVFAQKQPHLSRPTLKAPSWLRLPSLSPAAQLILMASIAVGLVLVVMLVLPRDVAWTGHGYAGQWYLAVGSAITAGVLIGRVLMTAAERRPPLAESKPIVWPSWMRWVTLAILVTTAGGIIIASYLSGNEAGPDAFPLASVGLVVGIGGAIWLVRRFEEMEKHYRKQAEQRAILRGD